MSKDILSVIRKRKSQRLIAFDRKQPVTKEEMRKILDAARWAPSAHNMQNYELIVIDDEKRLKEIGNIQFHTSDTWLKENYQNISMSEEAWRKKKVGLLGTMMPPAMRDPNFKMDDNTRRKMGQLWGNAITFSACIIVMLYDPSRRAPDSEGDFLGIMSLGSVMENIWLMATALEIDCQIISALGEEPANKEVKQILRIPDHMKVALGIRLGHAGSNPEKRMTVRRDIEDFTHHNRFGYPYSE